MRVALCIVQVLLVFVFVMAGGMKLSRQGLAAPDPAFHLNDATNDESR